jgi:hypothetical protein
MMIWAVHAAHVEAWNAYRILVGKPKGKTPSGSIKWDIFVGNFTFFSIELTWPAP